MTESVKIMRILVISAAIDPELGGPATVLQRHLRALKKAGVDVTLFGVADSQRLPQMRQIYPDARLFPMTFPKFWFYGAGLYPALLTAVQNHDVVHVHMLWEHSFWAAWHATRRFDIPLIVTPHGSLMEPWRYRPLHKRLYRWLILDPMLRDPVILHAVSQQEARASVTAGVLAHIRMVPNGLEAEEFAPGPEVWPLLKQQRAQQAIKQWPVLANQQVLLYLGRLWEGKGVMDLVEAWSVLIQRQIAQGWILVLAGPDYQGCRRRLIERLVQLEIHDQILLTGPVFEADKAALLALASGFVQPSHSEGASMALLEAIGMGLPVVMTKECHFPELARVGGGIEVPMGVEGVTVGMTGLLTMDPSEREYMGYQAQSLAKSRFDMSQIATELIALYQEAMGKKIQNK
ncbi:MAG: glycosyltransferase [Magnetococcus sp. YQC-5]